MCGKTVSVNRVFDLELAGCRLAAPAAAVKPVRALPLGAPLVFHRWSSGQGTQPLAQPARRAPHQARAPAARAAAAAVTIARAGPSGGGGDSAPLIIGLVIGTWKAVTVLSLT